MRDVLPAESATASSSAIPHSRTMSKSASAGSVGQSPKKATASGVETGVGNGEDNSGRPVMGEKRGSVDGERELEAEFEVERT